MTTKKIIIYVLMAMFGISFSAYAQEKTNAADTMGKKILVAFFSRAGENYNVGYIEKGNTRIVAEIISEHTGGKLFHIETETPYPDTYKECVEIAKQEKENNVRPALKGDISVEDYDMIFIGYPNWWGDMPMAVYTFIEKHNWQGKTVIPFCTHEGSGLSSTEKKLSKACAGSILLKGIAIQGSTAQKSKDRTEQAITGWLDGLFVKQPNSQK